MCFIYPYARLLIAKMNKVRVSHEVDYIQKALPNCFQGATEHQIRLSASLPELLRLLQEGWIGWASPELGKAAQ